MIPNLSNWLNYAMSIRPQFATATWTLVVGWCALVCFTTPLTAQQIEQIEPRGLQLGTTSRVVVTIKDASLTSGESPRVLLGPGWPVETTLAAVEDDRWVLHIHTDEQIPAGIHPLRIVTPQGISNALLVGVDRLPQQSFGDEVVALPVAQHGQLTGDQVQETTFRGTAGQRVVLDLEAQRLGSNLRPVMQVLGPNGRQIAAARPMRQIGGDPRVEVILRSTGTYRVRLHDIVYKGGSPGWFRLKLGDLQFADGVYPMSVASTGRHPLQFVSSNLQHAAVVRTEPAFARTQMIVPVTDAPWITGISPTVHLSHLGPDERREADVDDAVDVPVAINGRLAEAGQHDEFRLRVQPGSRLRVELFAHRWGSPLDAVVEIFDPDGTSLLKADDQPNTTDPGADWTVPDGCHEARLRISSLTQQGSEAHTYRLAVTPAPASRHRLSIATDRLNVPAGGRWVVPVSVVHEGDARALQLELPPALRSALRLQPGRIEAVDERGLIAWQAASDSRGVFLTRLLAHAEDAGSSLVTTAGFPGSKHQPAYAHDLMVAVVPPRPAVEVVWLPGELDVLAAGTAQTMALQLNRDPGADGPLRLRLMTSQNPAGKKEDQPKKLRLTEDVIVPAGESQATVTIMVPNDLPDRSWALALQAELLSDDQQQVRATHFSSVRRMNSASPVRLTFAAPDTLTATAGVPLQLPGEVARQPGFARPLSVRVEGLADGDPPAQVVLAADDSRFELSLLFPADAEAREIKDARLAVTFADAPESLAGFKRQSKAFTIKVVPAK